jgi:hypothetical protein
VQPLKSGCDVFSTNCALLFCQYAKELIPV